jgi:hypothetical protein
VGAVDQRLGPADRGMSRVRTRPGHRDLSASCFKTEWVGRLLRVNAEFSPRQEAQHLIFSLAVVTA